jgi:hypothetical protein
MMGILNRLLGRTSKSVRRGRTTALNLECLEDRMALSPWLAGQTLNLQSTNSGTPSYERSLPVTITQQVSTPWLDNAPGITGATGFASYVQGSVNDPATGVNEYVNGYLVETGSGLSHLTLTGIGYNNVYWPAHNMSAFGTNFHIPGRWELESDTFKFDGWVMGNNAATAMVFGTVTVSETHTTVWDNGYAPTVTTPVTNVGYYIGMA